MPVRCAGRRRVLLLLATCVVASGCAEPTAVRRTTLIPLPMLPARVGAPLGEGHGRAGLEVDGVDVNPLDLDDIVLYGEEGDPGVLVPDLHLGALASFAPSDVVELGARFAYTRATWADPNLGGVIALPRSMDRGLYMGGVGVRLNVVRIDIVNVALLGELNLASMPEAVFCDVDSCDGPVSADPDYVVDGTDRRTFVVPQLAALGGIAISETWFVDLVAGLTTSVTNVGFDRIENLDEDTTSAFWVGYGGAGVDFTYEWFFATLHLYGAAGEENLIHFGPRLALQIGYAF